MIHDIANTQIAIIIADRRINTQPFCALILTYGGGERVLVVELYYC